MGNPTVLVIGAGIYGIATAARLAQHGYGVSVGREVHSVRRLLMVVMPSGFLDEAIHHS